MQFAAFLEIVHAAAGLVKSSPAQNFWQWLGRANALLVFAVRIPEVRCLFLAISPNVVVEGWGGG